MEHEEFLLPLQAQMQAAAIGELRACAPLCAQYGLPLSEGDMRTLAAARAQALADTGRMEWAGGILPKLIRAFCDSPYAERESWTQTLAELQEAFYYFKTDGEDRFTDDELIDYMVQVFNGRAQGSAEYLAGTSLEALCRYARQGWDPHSAQALGDLF